MCYQAPILCMPACIVWYTIDSVCFMMTFRLRNVKVLRGVCDNVEFQMSMMSNSWSTLTTRTVLKTTSIALVVRAAPVTVVLHTPCLLRRMLLKHKVLLLSLMKPSSRSIQNSSSFRVPAVWWENEVGFHVKQVIACCCYRYMSVRIYAHL